jgi:hypothetical protein
MIGVLRGYLGGLKGVFFGWRGCRGSCLNGSWISDLGGLAGVLFGVLFLRVASVGSLTSDQEGQTVRVSCDNCGSLVVVVVWGFLVSWFSCKK